MDCLRSFGTLLLQSTMLLCSREEHALAIRRMTRIGKVSLFHVVRIMLEETDSVYDEILSFKRKEPYAFSKKTAPSACFGELESDCGQGTSS